MDTARDPDWPLPALTRAGGVMTTDDAARRLAVAQADLAADDVTAQRRGIRMLESLLHKGGSHRRGVVEELAAYIRRRSPIEGADADGENGSSAALPARRSEPPAEVQEALTVLAWRPRDEKAAEVNLRRADLSGADLTGAHLDKVLLSGSRLSGARLAGAELRGAFLGSADLAAAVLSGANLAAAYLGDACLRHADLAHADLRGAYLTGTDLSAADLDAADLSGARFGWSRLVRVNLSGARLSGADLHDADLQDADLSGADLSEADLTSADLGRANLSGADLTDVQGLTADQLIRARIDEATVLPAPLRVGTPLAPPPWATAPRPRPPTPPTPAAAPAPGSATRLREDPPPPSERPDRPPAARLLPAAPDLRRLPDEEPAAAPAAADRPVALVPESAGPPDPPDPPGAVPPPRRPSTRLRKRDLALLALAGVLAVALMGAAMVLSSSRAPADRAGTRSEPSLLPATATGGTADPAALADLRSESLAVRLDGIDSLMRDLGDPAAATSVADSLAGFVRAHTEAPTSPATVTAPAPDVQAALTALAHRPPQGASRLDLGGVHLPGVQLAGAFLPETSLGGAELARADISGAMLHGTDLGAATLAAADAARADLSGSNLGGADLATVNLNGADLSGTDLGGADLAGADLQGANLAAANLGGADLTGADLRGADLQGTRLSGARTDAGTRFSTPVPIA